MNEPSFKNRVLVASATEDIASLIDDTLSKAGLEVIRALDGEDALNKALEMRPALIILDMLMPKKSGPEVLRRLKMDAARFSKPIMIVTACRDEIDRVLAFELGAEDYLTCPFNPRELVLRTKAIISRAGGTSDAFSSRKVGAIELDVDGTLIRASGQVVNHTAIEYRLLSVLMHASPRVVSRDHLLNLVWGNDCGVGPRAVDTHVRRLRAKLGPAAAQIQSVRGFGYRLND